MTDLIVHVGLPKTGSTTLQKKIFRSVPGYLGINAKKRMELDLGKQFTELVPRNSNYGINTDEINAWIADVINYRKVHCSSADRLIISNEDLSNRSLIPFLKHFSKNNWTEGDVKAVLILRNQAEWLCSNYSQLSNRISNASQEHFENQVQKLIENGYNKEYSEKYGYDDHFGSKVLGFDSYYLDWSRRVKDLRSALGPENVCILLLEEMGSEKYWNKMTDFLHIHNLKSEQLSQDSPAENVKKTANNTWIIRPWNGHSTVMEKFNLIWPSSRLPSIRQKIVGIIRRTSKAFKKKRGTEIHLTEQIRNQIREFCRPFNIRLSEQLGQDIEKLGY